MVLLGRQEMIPGIGKWGMKDRAHFFQRITRERNDASRREWGIRELAARARGTFAGLLGQKEK